MSVNTDLSYYIQTFHITLKLLCYLLDENLQWLLQEAIIDSMAGSVVVLHLKMRKCHLDTSESERENSRVLWS